MSYLTPAYGHSASDHILVEQGDLSQRCDPGDSFMSDKGFNVQDIFVPDVSCGHCCFTTFNLNGSLISKCIHY